MIHNPATSRLGKKPPACDARTLRLAKYVSSDLPVPPASIDWTRGIAHFGVMANDCLSDCTIAACGHAVQIWTANQGIERTLSDDKIVEYYAKWDGYVPGEPRTDEGGIAKDVLNRWRKENFAGCILDAYAGIDRGRTEEVQRAIAIFGGLYAGIALPVSAQDQLVWDTAARSDARPGSWGGHAVFVCGYDSETLTCITWGEQKKMTWAFWRKYSDEAYALFSPLWLNREGISAAGVNFAALQSDLASIAKI